MGNWGELILERVLEAAGLRRGSEYELQVSLVDDEGRAVTLHAFAGIGVSLPHYSGYQYNAGTRVPLAEKKRGDMLFWGPGGENCNLCHPM